MLRKTNKAAITTAFEKNIEYIESVPQNSATFLDGMAVIQKLKIDQSNTFGDVAQKFSASILQAGFERKQVDVAFDVYIKNSIKNAERERRGTSSLQFGTLLEKSKVKQWKNFLSSSENKTLLIRFLIAKLKEPDFFNRLRNKELYVTDGASCFKITRAGFHEVGELLSIQEEADTRLFLHVKHAELNGYSNFVIHSPDTDVFIMAVAFSSELESHLYFKTGTKNKSRIISIDEISRQASIHANKLGVSKEEYKKSVLGVYCFTGCDTVSAFAGKGKLKAMKLLQQEKSL